MASEEQTSEYSASVSRDFALLFQRKLIENIDRKNQDPGRHIVYKKVKSVYAYEIGCMMHILGDAAYPLNNAIRYLETVLRDQMNMLLIEASEVSDSEALTHIPLLTLLANNREKMVRLLHYLFLKDSSELLGKRKYEKFVDVVINTQFGIRVETCLKFLRSIDAGDYDPEHIKSASDDIALERVARRFQMSRTMSNEQYLSFSKKQSVCFYPKRDGGKFKDWLLDDNVTDLQPTALALDILAFFARETIAELVEASLLIRQSENLSKSDLDFPSTPVKNISPSKTTLTSGTPINNKNTPSKTDRVQTLKDDSDTDIPNSPFHNPGKPGLTNYIVDCTDSNADISSLINSGALGMLDIFALSTSSLYGKDPFAPLGESPADSKELIETMDYLMKSDDEESVTDESVCAKEDNYRPVCVQEPKIPARDPYDPITVDDLRSAVINLIISSPGKIQMNKKKRILCL